MQEDLRNLDLNQLTQRLEGLQSGDEVKPGRGDPASLIHELDVHQLELEIQNRELREAQQHLEASRNEYAELYDFAPVGYLTLDAKARILRTNLTAAQMLGRARSLLVDHPLTTFLRNGDSPKLFQHLKQTLATDERVETELQARRSDGRTLFVQLQSIAACDEDGTPVCRTVMVDQTPRREAEKAALEKHAQIEALLDTVSAPLYYKDASGVYRLINRAFAEFVGLDPHQVIGKTDRDVLPGEWVARWAETDQQVLEFGDPVASLEQRRSEPDKWFSISKAAVRGPRGRLTGSTGFILDVTAQKKREARLQQQHDLLVREIHHRIKNHLQGLTGLLEGKIAHAPEAEEVLLETLMQVRSIALVYGQRSVDSQGNLSVSALLSDLVATQEGGSGYQLHCADRLMFDIRVQSEEAIPLALVVNELLSNAIKHGRAQTSVLDVNVSAEGDGERVQLYIENPVRENTPGFDFEHGRGLGTGLALVRNLLPGSGAELAFHREPGRITARLELTPPLIESATR